MSIEIKVELADTPQKREKGMMWRTHLDKNHGMLFIFPSNSIQSFWMKNTYINLDIAFISDSGVIFQIENMTAHSMKSVKSNRPCRYALEMNSGWFAKNGVKVGRNIKNIKDMNGLLKLAQVQSPNSLGQNPLDNIAPNQTPNANPTDDGSTTAPDKSLDPNATETTKDQNDPNQQQNQQQQQNQNASINRTVLEKIRYANENKLPMTLIYRTQEGNILPPRRLMPDPIKGYEFSRGLSKDIFRAIDASPTIKIGKMVIEGGHIKSFFVDNIISLEVEEKKEIPVATEK